MAEAGWYPDSNDATITRYWDGTRWTDERVWTGTEWVSRTARPPPVVPEAPAHGPAPAPQNARPAVTGYGAPSAARYEPPPAARYGVPTPSPGPDSSSGFPATRPDHVALPTLSAPLLIILAGAILAAVGVFPPWESDTFNGVSFTGKSPWSVSPALAILLIVVIGAIVWLGRRLGEQRLSMSRLIAMTVGVVALWGLPLAKFSVMSNAKDSTHTIAGAGIGTEHYGLGWGWFVTFLGLVGLTVGLIMAWLGKGSPPTDPEPPNRYLA